MRGATGLKLFVAAITMAGAEEGAAAADVVKNAPTRFAGKLTGACMKADFSASRLVMAPCSEAQPWIVEPIEGAQTSTGQQQFTIISADGGTCPDIGVFYQVELGCGSGLRWTVEREGNGFRIIPDATLGGRPIELVHGAPEVTWRVLDPFAESERATWFLEPVDSVCAFGQLPKWDSDQGGYLCEEVGDQVVFVSEATGKCLKVMDETWKYLRLGECSGESDTIFFLRDMDGDGKYQLSSATRPDKCFKHGGNWVGGGYLEQGCSSNNDYWSFVVDSDSGDGVGVLRAENHCVRNDGTGLMRSMSCGDVGRTRWSRVVVPTCPSGEVPLFNPTTRAFTCGQPAKQPPLSHGTTNELALRPEVIVSVAGAGALFVGLLVLVVVRRKRRAATAEVKTGIAGVSAQSSNPAFGAKSAPTPAAAPEV